MKTQSFLGQHCQGSIRTSSRCLGFRFHALRTDVCLPSMKRLLEFGHFAGLGGRQINLLGKLVRKGTMNQEVLIKPSLCRLGNWLPAEKHLEKRTRAFRGRMDELAIWNRALLESELRQMFEAGRPNVLDVE